MKTSKAAILKAAMTRIDNSPRGPAASRQGRHYKSRERELEDRFMNAYLHDDMTSMAKILEEINEMPEIPKFFKDWGE